MFMPQDIHMPCLDVNNEKQKVKKVIVKIKDYSQFFIYPIFEIKLSKYDNIFGQFFYI